MIPSRLRRHAGSFAWSAAEGFVYPVLLFAATPLFLATTGKEAFGLWLMVNAIVSLGGIVGFGTVEATTKFVAEFRGASHPGAARGIARHNLFIGLVGSAGVAGLMFAASPLIAERSFPAMGEFSSVVAALRIGALMLVVQQLSGILAAVVRAFERFQAAAQIEFSVRIAAVGAALGVAAHSGDIVLSLAGFAAVNVIGIVWRAAIVHRLLGAGSCRPAWEARFAGDSWRYARWNWLIAVTASLFAGLDRVLIGSLLGAAALAHYGIALQLASLVLVLPTTGLTFLVPVMARKLRSGDSADRARRLAVTANIGVTLVLASGLLLGGRQVLALWIGEPLAGEVVPVFYWLLGALSI